jgi:hypothetical protein
MNKIFKMAVKGTLLSLVVMGMASGADSAEELLKNIKCDRLLLYGAGSFYPLAYIGTLPLYTNPNAFLASLCVIHVQQWPASFALDKLQNVEYRYNNITAMDDRARKLRAEIAKESDNVRRDAHWRELENIQDQKQQESKKLEADVVAAKRFKKAAWITSAIAVSLSLGILYRDRTLKSRVVPA